MFGKSVKAFDQDRERDPATFPLLTDVSPEAPRSSLKGPRLKVQLCCFESAARFQREMRRNLKHEEEPVSSEVKLNLPLSHSPIKASGRDWTAESKPGKAGPRPRPEIFTATINVERP